MKMTGFEKAIKLARDIDPIIAAENCGFRYIGQKKQGEFNTNLINRPIRIKYPEFKGYFIKSNKELNSFIMTFILYHLTKSDGKPNTLKWINYSNLPDGQFYFKAMRSYTSDLLTKYFGNNLKKVELTAEKLGFEKIKLASDVEFRIQFLPMIPIVFQYSSGDDELPPYSNFLFDSSASHHLPTDCYAILCSWLTKCLIQQRFLL